MYKVGDKLKVNLAAADQQYADFKNTQAYKKLMTNAEKFRFEIVGDSGLDYVVKRLDDNEQWTAPKADIHTNFVLAED